MNTSNQDCTAFERRQYFFLPSFRILCLNFFAMNYCQYCERAAKSNEKSLHILHLDRSKYVDGGWLWGIIFQGPDTLTAVDDIKFGIWSSWPRMIRTISCLNVCFHNQKQTFYESVLVHFNFTSTFLFYKIDTVHHCQASTIWLVTWNITSFVLNFPVLCIEELFNRTHALTAIITL